MVRFLFFEPDFNNFDDVNPWKLTETSGVVDGVVSCSGGVLFSSISSLTGLVLHLEGEIGISGAKDSTALFFGAVSVSSSSSESENPGPIHKDQPQK